MLGGVGEGRYDSRRSLVFARRYGRGWVTGLAWYHDRGNGSGRIVGTRPMSRASRSAG